MATDLDKLQKQLDKKPSMLIEARELMDIMVTKEQVKKVLDVLLEKLQEGERRMANLVATSTSEIKETAKKVQDELKTTADKAEKQITGVKEEIKSDARTFQRMFDMKLRQVEEMIEYYDDTELRNQLNEVKEAIPEMPEAFDATELTNTIEKLQEDIEDLKKRPVGKGGGGVTDMRIAQAMKYIVKKETPVGTFDGANADFTVSQDIYAIIGFSLRSRVIHFDNYTINGKTITFDSAPSADYASSEFQVIYI